MSKRHTASRRYVQQPRMVFMLMPDESRPGWPMEWVRMKEEDAYLLAEVLRAEGKQFAIAG